MADQQREELNELERALAELSPRASQIDEGQLMFQAGYESALSRTKRRNRLWTAAAAAMGMAATVMAVLLAIGPRVQVVERIVYVPQPKEPATADNLAKTDTDLIDEPPTTPVLYRPTRPQIRVTAAGYLRDRQTVLTLGVDALPSGRLGGSRPGNTPTAYPALNKSIIDWKQSDAGRYRESQPLLPPQGEDS